jgi:hypothetical protein
MDLKKYAIIFSSFNAKFIFTQTALKPFSYIDTLLLSKPDESQFRFFLEILSEPVGLFLSNSDYQELRTL